MMTALPGKMSSRSKQTLEMRQIADNLPEVIHPLLKPLYEQFHFFRLTMDHVRHDLANLIV